MSLRLSSWSLTLGFACVVGGAGCRTQGGLGVHTGESYTSPPAESPVAEPNDASVAGEVDAPAYVLVRQREIGGLGDWHFAPDGALVAFANSSEEDEWYEEEQGCGVWEPLSGRLVAEWSAQESQTPCELWARTGPVTEVLDPSATRRASIEARALVISVASGEGEALRIPCPSDSDCDAALALAWSPDGQRIASASTEHIELWNIEAGSREAVLELQPMKGVETASLGWGDSGLVSAWVHAPAPEPEHESKPEPEPEPPDDGEDYDYGWDCVRGEFSVQTHLEASGEAQRVDVSECVDVSLARVDPRARFVQYEGHEDGHDGGSSVMGSHAALAASSTIGWHDMGYYYGGYLSPDARWSSGPRSQWLDTLGDDDLELKWTSVEFDVSPGIEGGELAYPELPGERELELLGSESGELLFVWSSCVGEGDERVCTPQLPAEACTWLSAAPNAGGGLMHCAHDVVLADAEGQPSRVLTRNTPEPLRWTWGLSGHVALRSSVGLEIFDPKGRRLLLLNDPGTLLPLAGASAHELAVWVGPDGTELWRLPGAVSLSRYETPQWTPTFAALAHAGDRLALSDGEHVAIISVETGAALSEWEVDAPLLGLAWRQDDAALFTGHTQAFPERAWEPGTGARAAALDPPFDYADLAAEHGVLDPSWRWIAFGSSSGEMEEIERRLRFVRVLDGLELWIEGDTVLAGNGQWDGDAGGLDAFNLRFGDWRDALVAPLTDHAEVLHLPGLFELWARGEPLPLLPL